VDELPPGRTPVKTFVVGEDKRERIHAFIRKLAGEGRQVFVVCPAVEDNEGNPDLRAVTSYAETLQTEVFPDLRIGLVHGKLAAAKKETIMRTFAEGGFDVLVASTVIEIGINVPNAALMVVENAERFGLSQLHQLRGRVGRGAHESFCVLFSHAPPESTAGARLHALASTHDGFAVAEEDLRLRGPGDFFGNRQHGLPGLRIADLCRDLTAAKQAAEAADRILADDPSLARAEHQSLRAAVQALFQDSWVGN
jgi:ATP-dependent DNA helicase RecG